MAAQGLVQCRPLGILGRCGRARAFLALDGLRRVGVTQDAAAIGGVKVKAMVKVKVKEDEKRRGFEGRVMCFSERKVKVKVLLEHQVQFGESHALLGSSQCAGAWQNRVPMDWTEQGWVVELEGQPGEVVEYKHVIVTHSGDVVWEGGQNRILSLPSEGNFEVVTHWDCTHEDMQLQFGGDVNSEGVDVDVDAGVVVDVEGVGMGQSERGGDSVNGSEATSTSFVQEWQGGSSRSGSSNGRVKWETSGLAGPALQLVEGDKSASNWWRKLEVVHRLLTGEWGSKEERLQSLVNVAVYLKWINTGQIACSEDGQHYRPNKHAEISRRIFVELERISGDKGVTLNELLVIRKIHPCLPAFKAEFTASVPLTRIRDIAHRNDIPQDLKQEIKHTIQNKLHRSAGPEDLVATEAMLGRITRNPGEYSEAFVNEFKTFYAELKDFFNAGSLTDQLGGLRPSIDKDRLAILDHFLSSNEALDKVDGKSSMVTESLLATLHALTSLRETLSKGLESGLRNDAPDEAIAMRQKWRLSELGLEDYSFVLLSRLINSFESEGGASLLAEEAKNEKVGKWTPALTALVMGIQQLGLSGLHKAECAAIKNELLAWSATGNLTKDLKSWALRLKATLDRARRLAETYTDTVLQLYPDYVQKLGSALGIADNSVRTYTEAEIRASVVFQIAKLCSMLLKAVRACAGGDGYDALMPGRAVGTLFEVDRIIPGTLPSTNGPVILLVKTADGDEEVKAAGSNVAGVVLQHELPHLSHLGVRARQEKVVFVTCDDEDKIADLRGWLNRPIELVASSESVHITLFEGSAPQGQQMDAAGLAVKATVEEGGSLKSLGMLPKVREMKQSSVARSPPGTVLDLADATTENAGSKAAACGALALLSVEAKRIRSDQGVPAAFLVPEGKVIPFGSMEEALELSGSYQKFKILVDMVETAPLQGGELDRVCNELRSLIGTQRPAASVLAGLASNDFPTAATLIVRSSANVEDLEGMSGAGLYESIPNVKLSEPESFGKAVAEVWASLYTRRAVLSRRVAGVPQKEACMAVLVQELLSPDLSFVLHTVSPIDHDESVVQAEIAVGLGETLASGTRGIPWRLSGNKFDGVVKTLAFANFSEQLLVPNVGKVADGSVVRRVVDYSNQPLSVDPEFREHVGQRLATIGFFLEQHFGLPQDIEGCIIGDDVYIVQARPQP